MIDTPKEAATGDKAARDLLEVEKLRAVNAKLLEALNRIVDWQLRPMESGVPAQKGVTDMQLHQARLAIKQAEEL
jgi:hypothetical protein